MRNLPAGVDAQVVDGYVRMWLRVQPSHTVVVLDYRGAPYLRFSRSGVQVKPKLRDVLPEHDSGAEIVPSGLTARTRPDLAQVSGGHDYEWHDGRLQALASIALAPGTRYVGRWSIPLRVGGRAAAISGGLWHAPRPSPVWFWPIAVILLCALAAWRVALRLPSAQEDEPDEDVLGLGDSWRPSYARESRRSVASTSCGENGHTNRARS